MQFLRGDFSAKSTPIRPPWSIPERLFVKQCTRCGDCVSACLHQILIDSRGGYPEVDFSKGGCLFCGDCARACKIEVLQPPEKPPWNLKAFIGDSCVTKQGVECRSCDNICEASAIRFRLQVGGPAIPDLESNRCTGCGFCYSACPVTAIELRYPTEIRSIK